MNDGGIKIVTQNRKARHDYHILDTFESGIALEGTEVKSLRAGNANLKDSYARVDSGEVWLHNMHISPYEKGNRYNHDPKRPRRLLLHKREIKKLWDSVRQKGVTIVPVKVYLKEGKAKIDIAVAKGKKLYDKRHEITKRDLQREMERRNLRSDY